MLTIRNDGRQCLWYRSDTFRPAGHTRWPVRGTGILHTQTVIPALQRFGDILRWSVGALQNHHVNWFVGQVYSPCWLLSQLIHPFSEQDVSAKLPALLNGGQRPRCLS